MHHEVTQGRPPALVSIAGLDRAEVLRALYNAARPLGLGLHQPGGGPAMTPAEASAALAYYGPVLDYLRGRALKIDLSADDVDPAAYDAANGPGAVCAAVAPLLDPHTAVPAP
jgi:hypothetical protein